MKVKGLFYKTYFGSNLLVHRTLLLTILTMTLLIMTLQIMALLKTLKMGEITLLITHFTYKLLYL